MMEVTWTEFYMPNDLLMDTYPEEDFHELDKVYTGEVIDTNRSAFWGYTYLVVACSDGVIREVEMSKVKTDAGEQKAS